MTDISLQQPQALLLIPALWLLILLALRLRRRSQQWEHLIARPFHASLLVALPRSGRFWPSLLLGLASLCLGLALSQPEFGHKAVDHKRSADLVIVIPLTQASLADDLPPSRLQLMQTQAQELIRQRLPAQSAMVVYAASAHRLMPLSNDPQAADSLLMALHPQLLPGQGQGQDAAAALQLAQQLLEDGRQPRGEILLYVHQLNALEQQQIINLQKRSQHHLTIVGFTNNQQLQAFAKKNRYGYFHLQQLAHNYRPAAGARQYDAQQQQAQGYWLVLPLLLLLAPLARKGWLLGLLLALLIQPWPALANEADPMWQGIAAYQKQDYLLASQHFAGINSAAGRYNQANALMHLARYQQAADLYRQALQLDPQLREASANLQLALKLQEQQGHTARPHAADSARRADSQSGQQDRAQTQAPYQQVDLDTWLRQIPDNPAPLLQNVFWYEYLQMEHQP